MAATWEEVWRRVRLHSGFVPVLLAQEFCREILAEIEETHPWPWLRAESQILVSTPSSGTCTFTRGSAVVDISTGTLAPSSSDISRQLRASNSLPATIIAVDPGVTMTLDQVWGGASGEATATILDAYVTMPQDFGRFTAVLDPANSWLLRFWVTDDELNYWDAKRTSSGTPRMLATRKLAGSTVPVLAGRVQYELWPYPASDKNYPYYYIRRPSELADTDYLPGLLRDRPDIVVDGALMKLAQWPGTEQTKNPYFNLALGKLKEDQFRRKLAELELRAEEQYMTWLETISWVSSFQLAPLDAEFMQRHDEAWYLGALSHW